MTFYQIDNCSLYCPCHVRNTQRLEQINISLIFFFSFLLTLILLYDVLNRQCLYYYRGLPRKVCKTGETRKKEGYFPDTSLQSSVLCPPPLITVGVPRVQPAVTHPHVQSVSPAPEYSPVSSTLEYKPVFSPSTVSPYTQSSPTFRPLIPLTVQNQPLSTRSTPALKLPH